METFIKNRGDHEGRRESEDKDSVMNTGDSLIREFISFARSDVRELAAVFSGSPVAELGVETDEAGVFMKRKKRPEKSKTPQGSDSQAKDEKVSPVASKYLGILRLLDSKGSPYVKPGDSVKKGKVLATVEIMNIKNEIKADRDGVLAEILEEDGKPVEYGQILFVLKVE